MKKFIATLTIFSCLLLANSALAGITLTNLSTEPVMIGTYPEPGVQPTVNPGQTYTLSGDWIDVGPCFSDIKLTPHMLYAKYCNIVIESPNGYRIEQIKDVPIGATIYYTGKNRYTLSAAH